MKRHAKVSYGVGSISQPASQKQVVLVVAAPSLDVDSSGPLRSNLFVNEAEAIKTV